MAVLVINTGSSSLKLTLFSTDGKILTRLYDVDLKGLHSPEPKLEITSKTKTEKSTSQKEIGIEEALLWAFDALSQKGVVFSSLLGIGHRFVHGGTKFTSTTKVTPHLLKELEALSDLAPLHNETALQGIRSCIDDFGPDVPQFVVFDTAFFSTLPPTSSRYAIPEMDPIRRFGFHGISHAYLSDAYQKISNHKKIITLHLGNGCSMAAISGGKPIDTTMGFSPAEGLVMSTRAGDIDPTVVEYLYRHKKKNPSETLRLLNFESGLLGVSGISGDMEILVKLYDKNAKAALAVDMFVERAVKYLGGYLALLGGADAIIFSGGIGENSPFIREKIIQGMQWYGVKLDPHTNGSPGQIQKISDSSSSLEVYVIATDENSSIAKEVLLYLK